MGFSRTRSLSRLLGSISALPLMIASVAHAQTQPADTGTVVNEVVVTGIRSSLRSAMTIKQTSQGVVDAISAEDMGKFPDTNLAESLQRITGVSIDRSNGEGSFVTVRGFGPEFNLVTLNGRQMPTSSLDGGSSAPASRSFDFANLASEGVAAVEVRKTGNVTVETGGIGSTINIRTPRPFDKLGLRGSLGVKGVFDTSRNDGTSSTPEISGIISDTFADGRFGVLLVGSYQKRKSSTNDIGVGWRDGYRGDENNWGSLAMAGDPRYAHITNRPKAGDVYQVPQSASYDLSDIDRERINGQLVLQYRPVESLTATLDYTYSRNTVDARTTTGGVWFNHNDTTSAWSDGPVSSPSFYSEAFGRNEAKDASFSGAMTANRSENSSLGLNLAWEATERLSFELDAHASTAKSSPTSPYGSAVSVGTAVFGVQSQTVKFDQYMPVISYTMHPGIDINDRSLITATGNVFHNAYFRDHINQVQLKGRYEPAINLLSSLDFGISAIENKVRSAHGYIQHDTWGGAGPASDIPDDIFTPVSLADKFNGLSGASDATMMKNLYAFDFPKLISILDQKYKVCGGTMDCLADYTTDRRIKETTIAPYLQATSRFDLFGRPATLVAGMRYEKTKIDSSALVPVPTASAWVSQNEFNVSFTGKSDFTTLKASYDFWLPAVDFSVDATEDIKLRASYSTTITRPDYASMQGGRTIDQLFRIGGGSGAQGNPGLLPYKSNNFDLSAEWYYGVSSYLSAGFFHKKVSNFISTGRVDTQAFGLTNPGSGPRYRAAIAALGANASTVDIRQYIFTHYPSSTVQTGVDSTGYITGNILGLAEDDPLIFQISTPTNSDQTSALHGFEFAVQHSFWETGFGVLLNYTIVRGDATYDNTQPASVSQFALTGLSDSANAVAFYDKNGIQARVAYNWRDQFLVGGGPNPTYVEAFGQIDASASWEAKPGLTLFVEGINLTGESRRLHQRSSGIVTYVSPGDARYAVGVRYRF